MLRFIIVLVAVLPLAACESDADFWQPYQDTVAGVWPFADSTSPATTVAAAPRYDDSHCQTVANGRAADAKANGFDDNMREEIYAGTYETCAKWDRAHPTVMAN